MYLGGIGNVTDRKGKGLFVGDHSLPVGIIAGKTGYHGNGVIDANTHNYYEEIPTLGVIGNMLMASSSAINNPIPLIPIVSASGTSTNREPPWL